MSRNTTPMGVGNSSFLLDRLGQDCAPLQFIRELTQNSIESIQKIGGTGVISWGFDMATYERFGVKKLCITDNGCGMTSEEMIKHINHLSDSGGVQSLVSNFGVGAKISAATRNPEGLIYLSWTSKEKDGAMVHLWKDKKEGVYGLRRFIDDEENYSEYETLGNEAKPNIISDHGTRVILLGSSINEETFLAPSGVTAKDRWILKYLNTRYFTIPDGITIKCQDGHTFLKRFRSVTGQKPMLDKKCLDYGVVNVTGAKVHWWIMPDTKNDPKALQTEGPSYETRGHVAAIYQNELYEMTSGRSARAMLQQFGIVFGTSRVVVYVEPDTSVLGKVVANTARTQLLMNNEPLPWALWAEEFRNNLPESIKNLMEEICSGEKNKDHEKSIRDRLKPLMHLYKVSRYKVTPNGNEELDDSSLSLDNSGPSVNPGVRNPGSRSSSGSKKNGGNKAGGAYHNFSKNGGKKGIVTDDSRFPRVTWISAVDGTREPGQLEDRAASYTSATNDLLVNSDFRVFTDMVDTWSKDFNDIPNSRSVCRDAVQMWFEQQLIEAVLGIQSLKDSKEWDYSQLDKALSEEALTMVVMPRYFVNYAVKRDVNTRMGKKAS